MQVLMQALAKLWATYAGADSAPAKPCAIYNCMKDSASRLLVLLTQAPAKLCVISASRTALLDWLFCWTQALAKLCATDAGTDAGSCETLCENGNV